MSHEYTRQRQERDFPLHETLRALEASRNDADNAKRGDEEKRSLKEKLAPINPRLLISHLFGKMMRI